MSVVTGSIPRSIAQKLSDFTSVLDFKDGSGQPIDVHGIVDSTVQMQAAANACAHLWIPAGITIKTSASITINHNHQIRGASSATIVNTTANPVFYVPNAGGGAVLNSCFLLQGFAIQAQNALQIGDPDALGPVLAANDTNMGGHITGMYFKGPSDNVPALEAAVPHTTDPATNVTVTGASNTNPIVITATGSFNNSSYVFLSGILGNLAANGPHVVTHIDATHFSLNGVDGTAAGAWAAGGTQTAGIAITGYWTAAYPALSALRGLGVAITGVNVYKYAVDNCIFEGFGIGIYWAGIDQSHVQDCRFHNNGRNVHHSNLPLSPNFSAGSCKFQGNDLGAPFFNGNLFVDGPTGDKITRNFFEATDGGATLFGNACTFIVTRGDAATQIGPSNEFILGSSTSYAPVLDLGGYQLCSVFNNTFATAFATIFVVGDYSNFNISFPVKAIFKNNTGFTTPNLPQMLDDSSNNFRFSYNSVPDYFSGKIPYGPLFNTNPWVFNATVQEWVLDKPGFQANVSFPVNPKDNRWHFKFMGMSTAGNDLTYSIYYVTTDGVRHKISGTLPEAYPANPFPSTNLGPGETLPFSLPVGLPSSGRFELDFSLGTGTVLYSAELVPEVEERRAVRVISLPLGGVAPGSGQPGTFRVGDVVLDSAAVDGSPPAWICTAVGTQNAIGSAVLGTITSGTTSLSITSGGGDPAALLAIREYISVVGLTGVYRILDLVSPFPSAGPAIATLDTPASASVSGAIISHSAPTWDGLTPLSLAALVSTPATVLTNTAIVTGGAGHVVQTPNALTTVDSSGNLHVQGNLTVSGTMPSAVTSVAGKTGAVTLVPGDVGLGSVTNDAQLKIASNLGDVASVVTARGNLSAVLKQALTPYGGGAASATYSQAQIAAIITTLNALVTAINT